jgi:aminoglycoside N3'-acetyltransferase
LRRHVRARRSLDPDLSVIALGQREDAIVGAGFTGKDPTGPDSPFQRVIEFGGVLVGLGVSLNYMNMIHVLDSRYRARYPFAIYSGSAYTAHTIDAAGHVHHLVKHAMLNELQAHIKPSRVVQVLKPGRDIFRALKLGETDFFIWDLPLWERLCVAHIEQSLDAAGVPCWLTDVEKHVALRQLSPDADR